MNAPTKTSPGRQTRAVLPALRPAWLWLLAPLLLPLFWRLWDNGLNQPAGVVSDLATAGACFLLCWYAPRPLRSLLLLCWLTFQISAAELAGAVQRLPSWQDGAYLFDPSFVRNSLDGFHLFAPWFAAVMSVATVVAMVAPRPRCSVKPLLIGLLSVPLLLGLHGSITAAQPDQSTLARYQALHWLIADALAGKDWGRADAPTVVLPSSLRRADLAGQPLLPTDAPMQHRPNVLLVVLEGVPGIFLPDIRRLVGEQTPALEMKELAAATPEAMLVPDFVAHSHQTIRGLYAIHCGDFSKFSYDTPKAFELQSSPDRAAQCLPAQLAEHGWQTHYLQGAPLAFMNKDQAMPAMGFTHVYGLEWFNERTDTDFIWGTTDDDFFRGASRYIQTLQQQNEPWFLSLLTVATHQPYAADEEAIRRYGSRRAAAIAHLDQALARFISDLRQNNVLKDTLVLITSDESHGAEGVGWANSWGLALVMPPESHQLPRVKPGTYGLVDIELSILDYLGLPIPEGVIGRSLFRDYQTSRDMVSYTGGFLRWQTADGNLYECSRDGSCRVWPETGIVGPRPASFSEAPAEQADRLVAMARQLDRTLAGAPVKTLRFADGQLRDLPETITNEWADNLVGAQYLDFPEGSTVHVSITLQALSAPPDGVSLKLILRQFEHEVTAIVPPSFPVLHQGQTCSIDFSFTNEQARQAFSFHLIGAGRDARIQLDRFDVTIDSRG